jgi:hypothetical protein
LGTRNQARHELIPVALAARVVYQQAYGALLPDAHLLDRLNGLAYWLARFGRLYALDERRSAPRRLSREELARAHFRHGGRELHFLDERAPILHLAVTKDCIDKTVRGLLAREAS